MLLLSDPAGSAEPSRSPQTFAEPDPNGIADDSQGSKTPGKQSIHHPTLKGSQNRYRKGDAAMMDLWTGANFLRE